MAKFSVLTALIALSSTVSAQCGSGTPDARVTGSGSSFVATRGSSNVYSGSDYRAAIQAAIDSISSGQVSQLLQDLCQEKLFLSLYLHKQNNADPE